MMTTVAERKKCVVVIIRRTSTSSTIPFSQLLVDIPGIWAQRVGDCWLAIRWLTGSFGSLHVHPFSPMSFYSQVMFHDDDDNDNDCNSYTFRKKVFL